MRDNITKTVSFLWATAIGGLFFLLPLVVVLALLGKVYSVVGAVAEPLHAWVPVNSPLGVLLLFLLAVAIIVAACFVAGVVASRALGRKFSSTIEKQLMTIFPKYAIYRDLLAGNLKHSQEGPSLSPVLVSTHEGYRLAFESDRLDNGLVVVFFPGAPDTWIGSVVLVPPERVFPTELPFNEAVGIFERLGRDSRRLLTTLHPPSAESVREIGPG